MTHLMNLINLCSFYIPICFSGSFRDEGEDVSFGDHVPLDLRLQ